MRVKEKLVRGVGINDADYFVCRHEVIDGKRVQTWMCPYYRHWVDLIQRCFSPKTKEKQPCYKDITMCKEWIRFSAFRSWMETQDWEGKDLDKDILVAGNKHYSPETCVFVSKALNRFLINRGNFRGKCKVGVSWCGRDGKFVAQINNPFTGRKESLGCHDDPEDGHLAWKKRKHELACQWAESVSDKRIAEALRSRFA